MARREGGPAEQAVSPGPDPHAGTPVVRAAEVSPRARRDRRGPRWSPRASALARACVLTSLLVAPTSACVASGRRGNPPPDATPRVTEPRLELSETVELPLERTAFGHLRVRAQAHGVALAMMLDTGASSSVLSREHIEALGESVHKIQDIRANAANGSLGTQTLVQLNTLLLGPLQFSELRFVTLDLVHLRRSGVGDLDGLLGRNWFDRLALEIDFVHNRLRVLPDDALAREVARPGVCALKMGALPGKLPELSVHVDGRAPGATDDDGTALLTHANGQRPIRGVLDLGSPYTILNSRAAQLAQLDPARPPVSTVSLNGADGSPLRAPIYKVRATGLFSSQPGAVAHAAVRQRVAVADPAIFAWLGLADEPAMVVGLDALENSTLILDLGRGRAWISGVLASGESSCLVQGTSAGP